MSYISTEYIFSDWIFAWFVLYYISIKSIKNTDFLDTYLNPKFSLYCALFQNIYTLVEITLKNPKPIILIKYFIVMLILKIIPLFLIREKSLHLKTNIPISICIFMLYIGFLYSKRKNFFKMYKQITDSIVANDNNTPLFWFLNKYFGI